MLYRDIYKLVKKDGWFQVGQTGSHRQFKHPVKPGRVTIAGHSSKEVAPKTLKSILEHAGVETMKYAVIYEKTRTGYSCYSPDLPGCIAAASTLPETEALMAEAIEMHVAGMREDGEPIPEPTTQVGYAEVA